MAVSATVSAFSLIDEYVLDGFKRAGLLPIEAGIGFDASWAAKATYGRRVLNRLVEGLANEGYLDQFLGTLILQLVAGTTLYAIDPMILNVVDSGSNIPAFNGSNTENTHSETPVAPMSFFEWNSLATKDSKGTPTRYWLDRNGSPNLNIHIWPEPTEASKIRFHVHRIPGDNSVGSNNVDLKRHWGSWIVYALAYEIATDAKLPLDERQQLLLDREGAMAKLKTYETSNSPPDVQFDHATPWSGFSGGRR